MTVMENIKFKRNITKLTGQTGGGEGYVSLIQDRSCDFNPLGALALTDKVLTPKPLQVNYQMCKADLIKDWQALQMKSRSMEYKYGADFVSFLISQVAGVIAQGTEKQYMEWCRCYCRAI